MSTHTARSWAAHCLLRPERPHAQPPSTRKYFSWTGPLTVCLPPVDALAQLFTAELARYPFLSLHPSGVFLLRFLVIFLCSVFAQARQSSSDVTQVYHFVLHFFAPPNGIRIGKQGSDIFLLYHHRHQKLLLAFLPLSERNSAFVV